MSGSNYDNPDNIEDSQIGQDFPVKKKLIYMNNGAIAPMPISTIKAMTDFNIKISEEGPDSKQTSEYTISLVNELRTRIAHLINCDREEVVITQSTTEGLNMVANGLDWHEGDSIIVRGGTHEHYANFLPWLSLSQRKKLTLRELALTDENGYFDLEDLERTASIQGVRMITMSHALYNTGAIMPLEQIGKIADENNILFCVDAAQTVGTIEVDVKKIGCHFMAFPGFKWLCGPTGIGIFYCSKRASEALAPSFIGGESASLSDQNVITYFEMPTKFQAGFRNFPGVAGLEASLRYILRLRIKNIRKKNMQVANLLREELNKIPAAETHGPEDPSKRTSIVTFTLSQQDPSTIVKKLEENYGIIFAARDIGGGRKAVRATPHFFNSEEEVVRSMTCLKNLL
jgi:cysteine desulfurase/selenocysteine lyase